MASPPAVTPIYYFFGTDSNVELKAGDHQAKLAALLAGISTVAHGVPLPEANDTFAHWLARLRAVVAVAEPDDSTKNLWSAIVCGAARGPDGAKSIEAVGALVGGRAKGMAAAKAAAKALAASLKATADKAAADKAAAEKAAAEKTAADKATEAAAAARAKGAATAGASGDGATGITPAAAAAAGPTEVELTGVTDGPPGAAEAVEAVQQVITQRVSPPWLTIQLEGDSQRFAYGDPRAITSAATNYLEIQLTRMNQDTGAPPVRRVMHAQQFLIDLAERVKARKLELKKDKSAAGKAEFARVVLALDALSDALDVNGGGTLDANAARAIKPATAVDPYMFEMLNAGGGLSALNQRAAVTMGHTFAAGATPAPVGVPRAVPLHSASVGGHVMTPDGYMLATGGHDGQVRVWDTRRATTAHVPAPGKEPTPAEMDTVRAQIGAGTPIDSVASVPAAFYIIDECSGPAMSAAIHGSINRPGLMMGKSRQNKDQTALVRMISNCIALDPKWQFLPIPGHLAAASAAAGGLGHAPLRWFLSSSLSSSCVADAAAAGGGGFFGGEEASLGNLRIAVLPRSSTPAMNDPLKGIKSFGALEEGLRNLSSLIETYNGSAASGFRLGFLNMFEYGRDQQWSPNVYLAVANRMFEDVRARARQLCSFGMGAREIKAILDVAPFDATNRMKIPLHLALFGNTLANLEGRGSGGGAAAGGDAGGRDDAKDKKGTKRDADGNSKALSAHVKAAWFATKEDGGVAINTSNLCAHHALKGACWNASGWNKNKCTREHKAISAGLKNKILSTTKG